MPPAAPQESAPASALRGPLQGRRRSPAPANATDTFSGPRRGPCAHHTRPSRLFLRNHRVEQRDRVIAEGHTERGGEVVATQNVCLERAVVGVGLLYEAGTGEVGKEC